MRFMYIYVFGLEEYSDIPECDSYPAQESCSTWPDHLFAVGCGDLGTRLCRAGYEKPDYSSVSLFSSVYILPDVLNGDVLSELDYVWNGAKAGRHNSFQWFLFHVWMPEELELVVPIIIAATVVYVYVIIVMLCIVRHTCFVCELLYETTDYGGVKSITKLEFYEYYIPFP